MNENIRKALHEFNMRLPAHKPYYRFDQLSPAEQSLVEQRAAELAGKREIGAAIA